MPQIQMLQGAPGFGSQLGQALGSGFSQGIQQGISTRLNQMLQSKKELGHVRNNVNQLSKRYGKDAFTPDQLFDLEKSASSFIEQNPGLSAQDATTLAFLQNQEKADLEAASKPKEKTLAQKLGGREELLEVLKKLGTDLKQAGEKALYPFVGQADFATEALSQIQQHFPGLLTSAPIKPPTNEQNLTKSYLESTGGVGPGENIVERSIQGALGTFHPAGGVGSAAAEVAKDLGAPPAVQAAADALAFVLAIKSGPKVGATFKANQKVLSNAERVAMQTGLSAEEVIAKAQQESGADLGKAAAGDAKEINKLNGRISTQVPKEGAKISATEKKFFSPKEAIKQREKVTAERLSKSPYEAYYEIENKKAQKEASKTAPTLAREAEITERLTPIEKTKTRELDLQRQQLRDLERDVKKLEGSDKARVESTIGFKKKQIQQTLDELRDIRHELKHFEKRPTESQLEADARDSAKKAIEEARNPTEAGQKKILKGLEQDKKFLDRAEKLLEHGEIPKDFHPDTYLRIKEKYHEIFKAELEQLKEANRALKGAKDAESLKAISSNKKAIESLENRIKRQKADIINQRDKIKSLESVKGAKGAFYKQQLRNLRRDIQEFQRDFFRNKGGLPETAEEVITQKVAKKSLSESSEAFKRGEQLGKSPTKENVQKMAEQTGESPKTVEEGIDKLKEKMKSNNEKIESGKATEQDIKESENFLRNFIFNKKNAKAAARHFAIGVATGVAENEFDLKLNQRWVYGIGTFVGHPSRIAGRALGFSAGKDLVNYIYNKKEGSKLKELRKNPNEYAKHIQGLKKRYSANRVNKMIENSKS